MFLEILLNSCSSVISYNNFDFEPIFGKKKNGSSDEKESVGHESTFMKQTLYFLITLVLNVT